jgi:hypothetical protein
MKDTSMPTKRSVPPKRPEVLSDEEQEAMREYAAEKKSAGRRGPPADADGEAAVLAKIAAMAG